MIKNDKWISQMAHDRGMIVPFVETLQTENVISYGLGSFGYDIRLSDKDFQVFNKESYAVDPKAFSAKDHMRPAKLQCSSLGNYFVLPPHTYALGVALEYIEMPTNITAISIGKSTYARCGVICNMTPVEAGWKGHLTLELSNSSDSAVRIYVNEGIAQLLFFEGEHPFFTYGQRKYQNQSEQVTHARI